ncbi:MAG: ornithine cyclodeaminase [Oscillochloridaceae bacterium]|nr:ornithine cyclodeaminase [Chloroflexaceae bacterium]MDW8392208.1 ornithine cyclodeaminase [Oscillochloridaceae bacterium]
MRILSADDVHQAVPMPAAIDAVESAFVRLSAGQADVPLRLHVETPAPPGVSFVMPARLDGAPTPALGVKVVSVFPGNRDQGEPAIYALVTLFDPETGRPLAVLDGTYLTALRTGAASGVATRHMARADAKVLALFGAGAQALPQALAVCAVRAIERIWIVNRTPARAYELVERLRAAGLGQDVRVAADPTQALMEADVICTATASPTPLFADGDVRPGTHINSVGSYRPSMAEIPPATVARAHVVVDHRRAAWAEAGDLIQARDAGWITEDHVIGELGEVAAGTAPGRPAPEAITFFKSVGNAVQDVAVAALALARARELGIGVEIEW